MNFHGMRFVASPLMVETVTEERRVLGGYLNRWLIRQVVTEVRPMKRVIVDRMHNCVIVHPAVLESIRSALR